MQNFKIIHDLDLTGKNIFIVGKPASGKTYLSEILFNRLKNHLLIHTDDFIQNEDLLIAEICNRNFSNYILEGNQAYTIFNKLNYSNLPNLIIELKVTDSHVFGIYKKERDLSKFQIAIAFDNYYKSLFLKYYIKYSQDITYLEIENNFL